MALCIVICDPPKIFGVARPMQANLSVSFFWRSERGS